jgi:acyl-CoA thioesterase I
MSERRAACISPHFDRGTTGPARRHPRAFRRYGDRAALVNGIAALAALLIAVMVAAAPATAQTKPRILAFGDSLTAGFGLDDDEAFPVRLQARLATDGTIVKIINGGVSGETTTGGLSRIEWALSFHPDAVLVELGANDALRGTDPKLTYANLDGILAKIQATHAKILLLGMHAPGNWGRDYRDEFDAIYPKLAEKYHVPLYPFFLEGVALDPTLNQSDRMHPNAKGVDIIVERIAPYVRRLLQEKGTAG